MSRIPVLIAAAFAASLLSGCVVGGDDPSDAPTVAKFAAQLVEPASFTFQFDASSSSGPIATYEWDFGDGAKDEGKTVEHAFSHGDGVYKVTLKVTDTKVQVSEANEKVTVGTGVNAAPIAFFKPSERILPVGEEFTFDASASTDPDGDPLGYTWDFNCVVDRTQYLQFKDAKANLASGAEEGAGGSGGMTQSGLLGNARPVIPTIPDIALHGGGDDHGGSGEEPRNYALVAKRTVETPTINFTYDAAANYYVCLTVKDVKGAFEQIRSEEIWVLSVQESPPATSMTKTEEGDFTLGPAGSNAQVPDETLSAANYSDEATYEFDLNYPLKSYKLTISWDQSTAGAAVPNEIDANVTHPDDKNRTQTGPQTGEEIIFRETNAEYDLPAGKYVVGLRAITGIGVVPGDFHYVIEFVAELDTNPFTEVEKDIPTYGPY